VRRPRADRGNQLGGRTTKKSVNALIADYAQRNKLWNDFQNTYILGLRETWDNTSNYKTMNAIVMASPINEKKDRKINQPADRVHRDNLPDPPQTWKQLMQHLFKELFIEACQKEMDQL